MSDASSPTPHHTANKTPRGTPESSPLARIYLMLYVLLIVYASLYPMTGWHDAISPPLSYLNLTPPRYWTLFDVVTNIIAYLPLGCLVVFASYPRLQRWSALVLAILIGSLVSGSIEALQSYLPNRVPSNLDLFSNIIGTLLGALFAWWQTRAFLDHGYLHLMRKRWFVPQASRGLLSLGLWPLAQLSPQAYLFGHGQVTPVISDLLSDLIESPVDLIALAHRGKDLSVEQYWLAETIITASGLCGAVLSMLWMLRPAAPRLWLMVGLVFSCLTIKSLATALVFTPEHALLWLTPGAQGGLLIGVLMLAGLSFAPAIAQRRLAALTLLLSLVVVNLVPVNHYFNASVQAWVQGKFINFNGAAQAMALAWPFLAVWCVWHPDQYLYDKAGH